MHFNFFWSIYSFQSQLQMMNSTISTWQVEKGSDALKYFKVTSKVILPHCARYEERSPKQVSKYLQNHSVIKLFAITVFKGKHVKHYVIRIYSITNKVNMLQ